MNCYIKVCSSLLYIKVSSLYIILYKVLKLIFLFLFFSVPNLNNNNNNSSNNNYNETPSNVTSLTVVKKPRPKTASPTRHGPQQCQVSYILLH